MRIKALKLISFIIFITSIVSCKKELRSTIIAEIKNETSKNNSNKHFEEYSFTISCGSGCALVYNAKKVDGNRIGYKVDQFINEVLSSDLLENELSFFSFECNNTNVVKSVSDNESHNILESADYTINLQEALKKVGDIFCKKNTNDINPALKQALIQLPFTVITFIEQKSEKRKDTYISLNDTELKLLKSSLFSKFYDEEYETINDIFKLNTEKQLFNNFIVVSENEVGYDYSLISVKNNNLISGLVLTSVETNSISSNVLINKKLIINLSTLNEDVFAQYKISNEGYIKQVFDNREHMKNYESEL